MSDFFNMFKCHDNGFASECQFFLRQTSMCTSVGEGGIQGLDILMGVLEGTRTKL